MAKKTGMDLEARKEAASWTLIQQADAIERTPREQAGALGFTCRAMAMASIPLRRVEGVHFHRENGGCSITLTANPKFGIPFGVMPRLLLIWLASRAKATGSRDIELGNSMSEFMKKLGVEKSGGARGSATQLKQQADRLVTCLITATSERVSKDGKSGSSEIINRTIADRSQFWWDERVPDQQGLWNSSVRLSEPFFEEVTENPIPVDLRAIKALRGSAMAMDIMIWATHRASYMTAQTSIPWSSLAMQFGADYGETRFFKRAFLRELKKVTTLYRPLRFEAADDGLIMRPVLTPIGKPSNLSIVKT